MPFLSYSLLDSPGATHSTWHLFSLLSLPTLYGQAVTGTPPELVALTSGLPTHPTSQLP